MKDKLELLGRVLFRNGRRSGYSIHTNSISIIFGLYKITKSTLKEKIKLGSGIIICCGCHYKWKYKEGRIIEKRYGYIISPATYNKIVKWSKSK